MPNWNELLGEIKAIESPLDAVRKKYLKKLNEYRNGRNTLTYYSSFLVKPKLASFIQDADKEMIMTAVHKLDKSKGLDLILNTEGGEIAATESIIDYLYKIFGKDISVFVPQISMSAGTILACAAKEIYLGLQSNLGPIDPQMNGISAKLVLTEYEAAKEELRQGNDHYSYWSILLSKYPPTFLNLCRNACTWSESLVEQYLINNMLAADADKKNKVKKIIETLTNPDTTYSHGRHIHIELLESVGLKIKRLEEDQVLQDLVLTVHHAYMHTFQNSTAMKIVENQNGVATIIHHSE